MLYDFSYFSGMIDFIAVRLYLVSLNIYNSSSNFKDPINDTMLQFLFNFLYLYILCIFIAHLITSYLCFTILFFI
jgi:uncharacterized membrane protein required for colicin V production